MSSGDLNGLNIFQQPTRTAAEAGDADDVFVVIYDRTTGGLRNSFKMTANEFGVLIGLSDLGSDFTVVDGTSVALSPLNGRVQRWTLGANRTPTAGTWAAGRVMTLMVADGASAFTVNWSTMGVVWIGGSNPTLPTTGYAVIELWKAGTTIYGHHRGNVA